MNNVQATNLTIETVKAALEGNLPQDASIENIEITDGIARVAIETRMGDWGGWVNDTSVYDFSKGFSAVVAEEREHWTSITRSEIESEVADALNSAGIEYELEITDTTDYEEAYAWALARQMEDALYNASEEGKFTFAVADTDYNCDDLSHSRITLRVEVASEQGVLYEDAKAEVNAFLAGEFSNVDPAEVAVSVDVY